MITNNKFKLIFSSALILLPMIISFFGGDFLNKDIPLHFAIDGTADSFMNARLFFVVFPLGMLVLHFLILLFGDKNGKLSRLNQKVCGIVFWLIPAITLIIGLILLLYALEYVICIYHVIVVFVSILFVIIGNYLPKTTRNLRVGIKVKWALSNDENWRATHRFAGRFFVVSGLLVLVSLPFSDSVFPFVCVGLILACAFVPMIYSYCFYKKHIKLGTATKEEYEANNPYKNKKAPIIIGVAVILFLAVVLFTGKIDTSFNENSLVIKSSFWSETSIEYEEILSVEYRDSVEAGSRVSGFGSARLLLGSFKNQELGSYFRYTYTGDLPCVVIRLEDKIFVVGAENESGVKEIYEALLSKIK